jgi:hypothetical protein
MEEIYTVLDAIFTDHPLSIAANEFGGRAVELVGEQQRGLLVASIGNGQLADGTIVFGKGDFAAENPRGVVGSQNVVEFNGPPADKGLL